MSLSKQQAIEIIERVPVGGAQFYSIVVGGFFFNALSVWYLFSYGKWVEYVGFVKTKNAGLMPMHEILAVAEGV